MSPEEKIEMGWKMIAEAEAEIAAKKRNWPNEIKPGMLFAKWGVHYIVARIERSMSLRLIGLQDGNRYSDDSLFGNSENEFAYIGLAKDCIKIADDAHEPTGAELATKDRAIAHQACLLRVAPDLLAIAQEQRGVMAADEERTRAAAMRVWGEHVRGCDTADAMADLIVRQREEIARLKARLCEPGKCPVL